MLPAMSGRGHWVYLIECRTGEIYVGQTSDLARRVVEHNTSPRGARFTSGRRPVRLRAAWRVSTRSDALRVEAFIRRGGRRRKDILLAEPRQLRVLLLASGVTASVASHRKPRSPARDTLASSRSARTLGTGSRRATARPRGEG
ncbi:MAG: GIY-YIG nuclease family protein [bacterium]